MLGFSCYGNYFGLLPFDKSEISGSISGAFWWANTKHRLDKKIKIQTTSKLQFWNKLALYCDKVWENRIFLSCIGIGDRYSKLLLTSDKNSHNFQHINRSETCKALCSEDCFSILDIASTSFQLKNKEALHIGFPTRQSRQSITFILIVLVNLIFFFAFSTPLYFSFSCSCCYLVINILCTLYLYHTD